MTRAGQVDDYKVCSRLCNCLVSFCLEKGGDALLTALGRRRADFQVLVVVCLDAFAQHGGVTGPEAACDGRGFIGCTRQQ